MGITFESLQRMEKLALLKPKCKVLDIGSSNLYSASSENIVAFLEKYAPAAPDIESFAKRLAAGSSYDPVHGGLNGAFVGELLEKAGMVYSAFDIADGYRTTILDLNHARLPGNLRGYFDLVLNFGTTEHILNQFNCFKVMHDATKLGGHIFHSLPALGYVDHGYITYTGRCLFDIAGYNEYEVVEFWFEGPAGRNNLYDSVRSYRSYFPALERTLAQIGHSENINALNELAIPDVSINIIYRKVKEKPFWGALESSTSVGTIPGQVTDNYSGDAPNASKVQQAKPSLKYRISRALEPYPALKGIARKAYRALLR